MLGCLLNEYTVKKEKEKKQLGKFEHNWKYSTLLKNYCLFLDVIIGF